jgi:hypothetical protein
MEKSGDQVVSLLLFLYKRRPNLLEIRKRALNSHTLDLYIIRT